MRVIIRQGGVQKVYGSTGLDNRVGFWATVTEVNAKENSVRVLSDTKQEYHGIPVMSKEWVRDGDDYVTGCRNLPPVGARVFVLVPAGTIASAFVLCSGFTPGDTSTHTLWAGDDEGRARIEERVGQGGWVRQESYDTGQVDIASKDEKLLLSVSLANETASLSAWDAALEINGRDKKIVLSAWDTVLELTSDGLRIKPKNLEIASSGDIVLDAGANSVTVKAARFSVNPSAAGASLEVV